MSARADVTPWPGNVSDPDGTRRVLVLPGSGYTTDMPGLRLPMRALALAGWQVWVASWKGNDLGTRAVAQHMVVGAAETFMAEVGGPPQLLLAKSLGTLAAGWAADQSVPAVWTTPLLTDEECVVDIARSGAPALLVAGTQDPFWDDAAAQRTGKPARVIPGADHAWQTGDWHEEVDVLAQVADAVETFGRSLD